MLHGTVIIIALGKRFPLLIHCLSFYSGGKTSGLNNTVAHICKHNKQFLKHNKHFSKHNIVLSEHNKLLSKQNTVLSKHNTILSKHNTVLLKHNTISSKHNTIYRNTTQSLQNTTQISQNTTQYLRNTTQSFPDYVMQDVTIQGINPGRYLIYDSYRVLIYIFLLIHTLSALLEYLYVLLCLGLL